MRTKFIGLVAALGMAVAAPAFGQDAKAEEILAKTRKALGDKPLKSLSLQASTQRNVNSMQMTSEIDMALEMPDKYVRSEAGGMMAGMTLNTGFNGDKAIMPGGSMSMGPGGAMVFRMGPGGMAPGGDAPKPTPEQQAEMSKAAVRSQRTEISRLMLGWFAMAHPSLQAQYTYAGEAESPDGKAYVIDVKDADGFAARLFIDQNNYLPLMVSYQGRAPRVVTQGGGPGATRAGGAGGVNVVQHAPQSGETRQLSDEERKKLAADAEKTLQQQLAAAPMVDFTMFFDDWREVDGVQFPHLMRRASGGQTTEEWTISRVKVNPKIDAKKFAVESK